MNLDLDGFPLVLVFIDVVHRCLQLITEVRRSENNSKYNRMEMRTRIHDQEVF